ncbi:hypothetical protein [Paenibacillus phocaensis]|uniref:hypothetical protein n=1 Tax=Paenibacillus phocaensis TaxID=1776378 RepID=UPI00039A0019|nr:hypothetical protein [Paenibacillus phocaensis]
MTNYFDVKFIKNWMNRTEVENKAIEFFWKVIQLYREEDPEEFEDNFPNFSSSDLEVSIQAVSVTFGNYPDFNYNHVVVTIPIRYKKKNIGVHKILFTFDGMIEDDYFIID